MTTSIKILIADDHSIVSRGLYYHINCNFPNCEISSTDSIKGTFENLEMRNISHLILDLNLSDGNSLEHIPIIKAKFPHLYILVHSMASEDIYAKKLFNYDISGFLSKSSEEAEIINALRIFLDGEKYLSKSLRKSFFNPSKKNESENVILSLSKMELKVLGSMLKSLGTKEIAVTLNIAQQTVATYKNRIFKKLDTTNLFDIKTIWDLYNF